MELYFTEPGHGTGGGVQTDCEGLRIFDVAVNDKVLLDDLDVWAEAGHCLLYTSYRMNGDVQRKEGTTIEFEAADPVSLLVGYFRDDQKKYAKAPKLETDASANDYGQAEPKLTKMCIRDR